MLDDPGHALDDAAAAFDVHTERPAKLRRPDQQRSYRGKADHHRMRNERDHAAQPEHTRQQLKQPGHDRQRQRELDVDGRARRCQFGQCREHDRGNRRRRPGHHDHRGPPDRGDHRRDHGGIKPVFRRQPGNDGKCHALRQDNRGIGQSGNGIVTRGLTGDEREPGPARAEIPDQLVLVGHRPFTWEELQSRRHRPREHVAELLRAQVAPNPPIEKPAGQLGLHVGTLRIVPAISPLARIGREIEKLAFDRCRRSGPFSNCRP